MVIKNFLLALTVFLSISSLSFSGQVNDQSTEIHNLRKTVIKLTNEHKKIIQKNELRSNHRFARSQAEFAMKVVSYEIYNYLKQENPVGKRSFSDIEKMVKAAYLSSWVFTDLGEDHVERFIQINQWAKDETRFRPRTKRFWKKGTYLRSIDKTVRFDNWDYGGWQVNQQHMEKPEFRSAINFLYDSGSVNFPMKTVKVWDDFLDINTNCVARCVIETDRKSMGWEWKHTRDEKFHKKLTQVFAKMEKEGLYDRDFVGEFYYITPIRQHSAEKKHSK